VTQSECSLFNSLDISKYDYGRGLTVSRIGKGQRSERSDSNEIDYNSLKYTTGLGLYILLNLNVY